MLTSNLKLKDSALKEALLVLLNGISETHQPGTTAMTTGQGYYFWYSEQHLAKVCQLVVDDPKIGKMITWKSLGQTIIQQIGKDRASNLDNLEITETIIAKIREEPQVYFCLLPIFGINVTSPFTMGRIVLYPSEQKEKVVKNAISNDNLEQQVKDTLSDTQNFATLRVKALDSAGAIDLAIAHVKTVLNILKFVFNTPSGMYQIGIGKKNKTVLDKEFLAVAENHGLTQHPFNYLPQELELSEIDDPRNIAAKNYIDKISIIEDKFLGEKSTVPLERGLLNATNLVANGLDGEEITIQLIQLMSAIESLVEQKTFVQSITDQVCERVAQLLGTTEEGRMDIYKTLSVLYGKRSDLSHGEIATVTHYDISNLWVLARGLCLYFRQIVKFKLNI